MDVIRQRVNRSLEILCIFSTYGDGTSNHGIVLESCTQRLPELVFVTDVFGRE